MVKKKNINHRAMMERAIQVMRETVDEPRDDGKPSPLVGAVLKEDSGPSTCYRIIRS